MQTTDFKSTNLYESEKMMDAVMGNHHHHPVFYHQRKKIMVKRNNRYHHPVSQCKGAAH